MMSDGDVWSSRIDTFFTRSSPLWVAPDRLCSRLKFWHINWTTLLYVDFSCLFLMLDLEPEWLCHDLLWELIRIRLPGGYKCSPVKDIPPKLHAKKGVGEKLGWLISKIQICVRVTDGIATVKNLHSLITCVCKYTEVGGRQLYTLGRRRNSRRKFSNRCEVPHWWRGLLGM